MKILLELDAKGRYENPKNIKKMDAPTLETLINNGLENYSSTDAEKIVRRYCELTFSKAWKSLTEMYPLIYENINENGAGSTNTTDFYKFLVEANDRGINFPISPSQGQILYNCMASGRGELNHIDPLASKYSFIYDKNAYGFDSKLKTCIFVSDNRNIKKFGLVNDATGAPLSVNDVLAVTNERQLQQLVNGSQKKRYSNIGDIYDVIEDDGSSPDINIKTKAVDKKSLMRTYIGGVSGAIDALRVWETIVDRGLTKLERKSIDDDDIVTNSDGSLNHKATIVKHLTSLKDELKTKYGITI